MRRQIRLQALVFSALVFVGVVDRVFGVDVGVGVGAGVGAGAGADTGVGVGVGVGAGAGAGACREVRVVTATSAEPPQSIRGCKLLQYGSADSITVAIYSSPTDISWATAKSTCESAGWQLGRFLTPGVLEVAYKVGYPFVEDLYGGRGAHAGFSFNSGGWGFVWLNTTESITAYGAQWYPKYPSTPTGDTFMVAGHDGRLKFANTVGAGWHYFYCTSI